MASEEPWKKPPMSVGLPTPPSTPEKCSQRLRNNMKLVDSSALNLQFYASPVHQSQNNNLQVVPDAITGDDVQDIIPFLTDLGNRSMASPNFFDTTASQGQCNSQAKHSPPLSDNVNHSPSFHADQNGVSQFHDTEQSYNHSSNIFSDCSTEGKSFSVHDFTLSKSTPYLTQPIAAMTPKYHRIPPVLKQTLFVNGQSTRALWSTLMVNSQLEIVSSNWNESLKVAKWGICVVNQAGVSLKCYSKNLSWNVIQEKAHSFILRIRWQYGLWRLSDLSSTTSIHLLCTIKVAWHAPSGNAKRDAKQRPFFNI